MTYTTIEEPEYYYMTTETYPGEWDLGTVTHTVLSGRTLDYVRRRMQEIADRQQHEVTLEINALDDSSATQKFHPSQQGDPDMRIGKKGVNERARQKTKEKKDGDCFIIAAHVLTEQTIYTDSEEQRRVLGLIRQLQQSGEELAVVHGLVTRPTDQRRHVHAWVEAPKMYLVFDLSNGHSVVMSKGLYYDAGKIDDVRRYPKRELIKQLLLTEHYGPWAEELKQHV